MEFFAPIVKADSLNNTKGRNPIITIAKEDKEAEYWPRLTKDKVKNSRITVDWNKWVDEDEEDEAPEMGGDFDPAAMSQFGGGAGGMPGMPGGMGGMPGMGGAGAGGMPGGMDMEALMKQMGQMGGGGADMGGDAGEPDSDDDSDDDDLPELEEN